MYRLAAFGGLTLLDPSGSVVPLPRLRLALLAALAVAGPRGVTRDKLLALLWPESTAEHARHALEQLLYALRRQLPRELLTGTDPLRLNPAAITSDVGEFERAVADGDPARAVARYAGPFLDGFFLTDAPEFEAWLEAERARLAREHTAALRRMARDAGARGQHTLEIDCWRRLRAVEPLSERTAEALVRALAKVGDWSAALRQAREYDALVSAELAEDRAPLGALVERLRAESGGQERAPVPGGDRYRILRQIARGSMATVYLARDRKLERQVALKLLRPELAASAANERFHREIAIVAALHHPHILQIHDSGVLDPGVGARPYYVMPYVEGENLRERLDREVQLPVAVAVSLACEVADALSYAHRRGIVHRDVKPENILLESGHALVADFGIARALDLAGGEALSLSGVRLGTPGYMSPEQAAGARRIDRRSDVYALGCVIYEMLAGQPPFTGATTQALLARHALDPVPSLRTVRPDVPETIESAVRKALAKAPEARFGTAEELARALQA